MLMLKYLLYAKMSVRRRFTRPKRGRKRTVSQMKRSRSSRIARLRQQWVLRSRRVNLKNGGGTRTPIVYPKLNDPILIIDMPHVNDLLSGKKTIETRSTHTRKMNRTVVFFCGTGTKKTIYGYAYLRYSIEFESDREFHQLSRFHGVKYPMKQNRNHGWLFTNPHRYETPIQCMTNGGQVWSKFRGLK